MTSVLILTGIFAGIGMIYTCKLIAKAILWVVKYKEAIEAYAKLQNANKEG